jgi:hypothetical protein
MQVCLTIVDRRYLVTVCDVVDCLAATFGNSVSGYTNIPYHLRVFLKIVEQISIYQKRVTTKKWIVTNYVAEVEVVALEKGKGPAKGELV